MTGAGVGVIIYSSSPLLSDDTGFNMALAISYFATVVVLLLISVIFKIDYKN
jgi:hypothetical protein